MAFAQDQFKVRADRDGATIIILLIYDKIVPKNKIFDLVNGMAEDRDIRVIDQYNCIMRQGGRVEDAHFPHDAHWNPAGH